MNNTTYTANKNCFLIDGEICLFSEDKRTMHYSTDKFYEKNGVKILPRDKFVKPKDVEALAEHHAKDTYKWPLNKQGEPVTLPPSQTTPPNYTQHRKVAKMHFKAGHNANPNEFTRDEMVKAMEDAYNYPFTCIELLQEDKFDEERDRIINSLRPLSLPASVEINEQGEIENIKWT